MASRMQVSRVLGEDDDDDDVGDLFDSEFLGHMEALKHACQMLPGAEVRLKSTSTLAASKFEEEGYEEDGEDDDDNDDALLLSIERKFLGKGGVVSGSAGTKAAVPAKERINPREHPVGSQNGGTIGKQLLAPQTKNVAEPLRRAESSDDEDDDLLRSVKECCGALDLVKASKNVKTGLLKDSNRVGFEGGFPERVSTFLASNSVLARDDENADDGRLSFPVVGDDVREDFQPNSSYEDGGRSSAHGVNELQSFLPAQLGDEELEESPLPLIVRDPNLASHGAKATVPESVQAVTEALLKNRLCQQTLRELLRQVELKLHENQEMQRRAVSLVEYEKACTRKFCGFTEVVNRSVELIATKPVSKKKTGEFVVKGPPDNPDVKVYRKLQSQLPAEFNVKKWTKKETQALVNGVRQQLQEIRLRALMEDWESDVGGQDFDEQMRSIGESDGELNKGLSSVDWSEVARIYVNGRSQWECKLQWENNDDPSRNSKAWTKAEDKKLLSIVQAHDLVEWAAIADELGTRRTPAQCAIRFQRSLNASILRSAWTPEEDEQLQAAVEKFGEKDWQSVAACMEGRLGSQCMSRWTKVLHPDRHRRGRWLAEEDTRLKWAVSVYGPRGWKNIAAHVPGRSDVQCRERWCNVLDPSLKIDDWSAEEDAKLEELVVKYGRHRWAAVGAELGRTDNQCFRHWKLLHPEHKISFKKDMAIRRAALATNFVGREKERSDLGLQDFLPPPGIGEEDNSRPLLLKSCKVIGKPVKRSIKRKTRELSSNLKENPPSELVLADDGSEVPVHSCSNSSTRLASMNVEGATQERKTPECLHTLVGLEIASADGSNEVRKPVKGRRTRRPSLPGERAFKKRKSPEHASVVTANRSDSTKEIRDEKDVQLIVYTRRKNRASNSGNASHENSGTSELTTVGIEMSSVTQGDGTLAANAGLGREPKLPRQRKGLLLPDFLYGEAMD